MNCYDKLHLLDFTVMHDMPQHLSQYGSMATHSATLQTQATQS